MLQIPLLPDIVQYIVSDYLGPCEIYGLQMYVAHIVLRKYRITWGWVPRNRNYGEPAGINYGAFGNLIDGVPHNDNCPRCVWAMELWTMRRIYKLRTE